MLTIGGYVPNGIRTRVLALKGPRPGPLDDGDAREKLQILTHAPSRLETCGHPHTSFSACVSESCGKGVAWSKRISREHHNRRRSESRGKRNIEAPRGQPV